MFSQSAPRLYAVERFVDIVWRGVRSPEDPKTLELLAATGGTSRSPLKTLCKTLGIRPRDARDFTRLLRVFVITLDDPMDFHNLLQVSAVDTMANLFARAGLEYPRKLSPLEFLDQQRLVHNEHVIKALREPLQQRLDSR